MAEQTPVIVSAKRTPQGKSGGLLADIRSEDLSIPLIETMLEETGLTHEHIEDVLWGCARQRGEQATNIARQIAIFSMDESVPGTTMDRQCASSAQALISASDAIAAGRRDAVFAGGVESMSRYDSDGSGSSMYPKMGERYGSGNLAMGITAEKVAEEFDISREEQDEYGARSQQRACEATEEGRFDEEIVPIDNGEQVVEEDEGLRPGTTPEVLADLPPVFKEDGTVTAGTSSQVSDGAAALLVTSKSFAEDQGLDVLAEIGTNNVAGVDPTIMGIGPVPAVEGLLERAGRDIDDYGLVELNEAFASQTLYCQQELGIPDDRFNVLGGAIAIGHPLGCSGARLPVTLAHTMNRRGVERGIATECVGFGQGAALELALP